MKRRRFVQLSGSALAAALAGCSGGGNNNSGNSGNNKPKEEDTRLRVGESATYKGVKVTLDKYALVDKYSWYNPETEEFYKEGNRVKTPPTAGGTFLFAHITVENVGGKRRRFPSVANRTINATYNGQEVNEFAPEVKVKSKEGTVYESYTALAAAEGAVNNGAYPGVKIEGWIIFEVPRAFNPTSLTIKFVWGPNRQRKEKRWTVDNKKPVRTPEGYDHEIQLGGGGNNTSTAGNNTSTE